MTESNCDACRERKGIDILTSDVCAEGEVASNWDEILTDLYNLRDKATEISENTERMTIFFVGGVKDPEPVEGHASKEVGKPENRSYIDRIFTLFGEIREELYKIENNHNKLSRGY